MNKIDWISTNCPKCDRVSSLVCVTDDGAEEALKVCHICKKSMRRRFTAVDFRFWKGHTINVVRNWHTKRVEHKYEEEQKNVVKILK